MFNNNGESQMDKTILVVEVTKYSTMEPSYSVKKTAESLDKASEYLVALKNLNDSDRITYELFNRFGQFEVEQIQKVANDK